MAQAQIVPVRRALLSVSDKTGITEFAAALHGHGVELLSTGGTYRALSEAGIPVTEVSTYTGFPEMMDGRVKTLHPKVHGGLLGRRGSDSPVDDSQVMSKHGIDPIDLLVVNLYPFEATIAQQSVERAAAIENIDIGGPAMLRSAAKNHASVTVVIDPNDYSAVLSQLDETGAGTSLDFRQKLAAKTFRHTASYDAAIAAYLTQEFEPESYPERLTLSYERVDELRYGENPHQSSASYRQRSGLQGDTAGSVVSAAQVQGKGMSFCNVMDADAAFECVSLFDGPACVIVKHANPCGVATGVDLVCAYDRAYAGDPVSAFGGIIAFNRSLDAEAAQAIVDRQVVDVIVVPGIDSGVEEILKKRRNARVLVTGGLPAVRGSDMDYKRIASGLLLQSKDTLELDETGLRCVTEQAPDEAQWRDLRFAWRIAWYVKSNAIVYARDEQTVGIGAGQMSRVISARIAEMKAHEAELPVPGAVMASDAFFPFRDGIDAAAAAGIKAIIQPGGSMRDEETIAAANEHGIAMVFTGIRHFRH